MALALASLYRRVAEDLGILGEGIPFEDADEQLISAIYDEVYAELDIEGIVDWGSSEAVPDEYVSSVVDMVAARTAPKFTLPPIHGPWEQFFQTAEVRLRRKVSPIHTPTTTPATYF